MRPPSAWRSDGCRFIANKKGAVHVEVHRTFFGAVHKLTVSDGPIFRCTTKDRGERRGKGPAARRRKLRILRFGLWAKSSVAPLLLLSPPNPLRWALAGTPFVGSPGPYMRLTPSMSANRMLRISPKGTSFGRALVLRPNSNQGAACHVVASSVSLVLAFGPKAQSLRYSSFPHQTRFAGLWRGPQFLLPPPSYLLRCVPCLTL